MIKTTLIRTFETYISLLLVTAVLVAAAPHSRIVVIGDIHGSSTGLEKILQRIGLMNNSRRWTGGDTVLVQTGDVVDRGPDSRDCLDLLMDLERQGRKRKSTFIALLGNHEVMAMTGDLRYVRPEDYSGFATKQSATVREAAYREYLDFTSFQNKRSGDRAPAEELARDKWLNEHPLGFFERRDAFGPQGIYGRWIRGHDAVAQIGDVVFVHGGLNPNIPFRDIRELNQRIHTDLATFDSVWQSLSSKKIIWRYSTIEEALGQAQSKWADLQTSGEVDPELREDLQKLLSFPTWFINSPDSPLWYRGLALESEEELKPGVDAMFARLRIGHIVAGHTINPDAKIARRFGERVFLIDTGMFETGSGDRASALEIQDGRFVEHYALDTPQTLMPADSANPSVGTIQKNSGPAR